MNVVYRKLDPVMGLLVKVFYNLPVSVNLSVWWNFGSLLGLCLMIQVVSGLALAVHYVPHIDHAFESVMHIMRDVNMGWLVRSVHANGASLFFICVYVHIGRGLYYGSYKMVGTWVSGVLLLILLMVVSFLGYVLPWGQMSYWAAMVITNMVTIVPYLGKTILYWIWGGSSMGTSTLGRIYLVHVLLPFIMILFVLVHIHYLHNNTGNNPLGVSAMSDMVPFHVYYTAKDLVGFVVLFGLLGFVCLMKPGLFMEVENFTPANPMHTPSHIQPEWYFLFAYGILRSIPNKVGGVLALVFSVLVLLVLPLLTKWYYGPVSCVFNCFLEVLFWVFTVIFILLSWIGTCPIEEPFITIGQWCTFFYFSYFLMVPFIVWCSWVSYRYFSWMCWHIRFIHGSWYWYVPLKLKYWPEMIIRPGFEKGVLEKDLVGTFPWLYD